MNETTSCLLLVVLAVSLGVGTEAANFENDNTTRIEVDPPTPNTTATHTVINKPKRNISLQAISIDYGADVFPEGIGTEAIEVIGIDRKGDGQYDTQIDQNLSANVQNVSAEDGGQRLSVSLGGQHHIGQNDELVMVYSGIKNPAAGNYSVFVDMSPIAGGGRTTTTVQFFRRSPEIGGSPERVTLSLPAPETNGFVVAVTENGTVVGTTPIDPSEDTNVDAPIRRFVDSDLHGTHTVTLRLYRDVDRDGTFERGTDVVYEHDGSPVASTFSTTFGGTVRTTGGTVEGTADPPEGRTGERVTDQTRTTVNPVPTESLRTEAGTPQVGFGLAMVGVIVVVAIVYTAVRS